MTNCCTTQYIKVPNIGVSGDIILKRSEPGVFPYVLPIELEAENDPSCGYYEYYSGTPELDYSDYYEVDVQYNSGSGFWTFSGNSLGFDDPTVYRSVKTGVPCDPLGDYTGGIFNVNIKKGNKFDTNDFDKGFVKASENEGLAIGSGVHKEKDVNFKFSFRDPNGYLKAVVYDVLDINGGTVYQNYLSGNAQSVLITEKENIKIFGSYTKDFGMRARAIDKNLGEVAGSESYTYGNVLYIDSVSIQDSQGTTNWETILHSNETETIGVIPSGAIPETEPRIKAKVNLFDSLKNINLCHLSVYASETEDFIPGESNFKKIIPLINGTTSSEFSIDQTFSVIPNKNYYFAIEGYSKVGKGNTIKFGPHKIFQREGSTPALKANDIVLSYKDSDYLNQFKTGQVTENLNGPSGVLDTLIINKETYGSQKAIYNQEKFLFNTIPTTPSGKWKYTTFDYFFEFKDKNDDYSNLIKNIKLTATGTSLAPLNSGMPMFKLIDDNTGVPVNIDIAYNSSGFYLLSNTGHQYQSYKYTKNSF